MVKVFDLPSLSRLCSYPAGGGCYRRAEHLGAWHADDPQDVPLCGRGEHERDAGSAPVEGDHQRV